ncbi:hypothetical protein M9H77_29856 [Catharanthus roseus]|uniref:Uncharacterized protein n=1 Tax=Catharanthus roseus TaxID=4058 RepID=A0ACB9ZWE3_CATRO|nr:hypothetical protein M9H77_29856 [Catharanthus roseus]
MTTVHREVRIKYDVTKFRPFSYKYSCQKLRESSIRWEDVSATRRGTEKPPWLLVSLAVRVLQKNSPGCLLCLRPISDRSNGSWSYYSSKGRTYVPRWFIPPINLSTECTIWETRSQKNQKIASSFFCPQSQKKTTEDRGSREERREERRHPGGDKGLKNEEVVVCVPGKRRGEEQGRETNRIKRDKISRYVHRWIHHERTLVGRSSKTIPLSSSYSLWEVVLERIPVLVVDLSDIEPVDGPAVREVEIEVEIEEDPSEPKTGPEMEVEPDRKVPIELGGIDTPIADASPLVVSPTPVLPIDFSILFPIIANVGRAGETVFLWILRMQREREIIELIEEQDWLRQFSTQFLGTTRDFTDRTHAELEARMSGTRSPNLIEEATSENSQNRQSEQVREATSCLEQATHGIIRILWSR